MLILRKGVIPYAGVKGTDWFAHLEGRAWSDSTNVQADPGLCSLHMTFRALSGIAYL